MLNKSFLFLVFAHVSFIVTAQQTALDKAFHVPANFQQSPSQMDSLIALGPQAGKAEYKRLYLISRLYRESDTDKAMEFTKSSIEQIEKGDDLYSLQTIYTAYGHTLQVQGNYPAATRYFTKALAILEKQKDTLSMAYKYILLAYTGTTGTSNEYETKMAYLGKSFELFKRITDYEGIGGATHGMALDNYYKVEVHPSVTNREMLLKEALEYAILAEKNFGLANWKDRVAATLVTQGQIHALAGRLSIGRSLIQKGYLLHKKEKSNLGMQRCAWSMAKILFAQQKYDSAIFFMQQSAILLEKANTNSDLAYNYDFQTLIFKAMKNYPEALRTNELARGYYQKTFTVNRMSEVNDIKNSYENQLKDSQIKELESEKLLQENIAKQQAIISISVIVILSVIIGLGGFAFYQRRKSVHQMKENIKLGNLLQKNLEDKLQDTQLAALKAQMNPHFVGNAIIAVQNLILQEKKEDALHYLNDFSKLTRHALENSKKETISLKEEVEFLEHYFHLEQLRYPNKFDFEITIDQSIDDPGYERIPPMMVQPFVENAIKHGLHFKHDKGFVKVVFQLIDANLRCTIEDNGVGRGAAALLGQQQRTSHSTAITDARLELLQQKAVHQNKYKIQIEDLFIEEKAAGTRVVITIPTGERSLVIGQGKI